MANPQKVKWYYERFDGGWNTKASPGDLDPSESPDLLNVQFDDTGGVATRDGSAILNTQAIGSAPIDQAASYNGSMVVWAGGDMYAKSGTTFVTIASAQSQFVSGVKVAYTVYQNLLMFSDGTGGPWKYSDRDAFYQLGISTPSACTGASGGSGPISAGTYYYKVSYVNSQVVEGEAGSASVGVVLTNTAAVDLTDIPVGATSLGVDARNIYRSTSSDGPFYYIAQLADNSTTTYTDTTAVGDESTQTDVDDATAPNPWNTVAADQERLWFDNKTSDKTILGYTELANPFISEALNLFNMGKGDGQDILALVPMQDLLAVFKDNSIWIIFYNGSTAPTSWQRHKTQIPRGIVSKYAWAKTRDGILYFGKDNEIPTGAHIMTGVDSAMTTDGFVITDEIADKIENQFFNMETAHFDLIEGVTYKNKHYFSFPKDGDTSFPAHILVYDDTRVTKQGQPGIWYPWDGINVNTWVVHDGVLYSGDSQATGYVRKLFAGVYNDSGEAINSYFWAAEAGGEKKIEDHVKTWRKADLWYGLLGAWNMRLKWREGGAGGVGNTTNIDLTPGGTLWGAFNWGEEDWSAGNERQRLRYSLGILHTKLAQIGFDNNDTVGQAFSVYRAILSANLKSER